MPLRKLHPKGFNEDSEQSGFIALQPRRLDVCERVYIRKLSLGCARVDIICEMFLMPFEGPSVLIIS